MTKKQNHVYKKKKMPKRYQNGQCSVGVLKKVRQISCAFCQKALSKKELELHFFVCEKVPQEIFDESNIYFKTPLEGSSVSFGTTCNSSLTNPLLGARFVVPPPPLDK